MTSLITTLLLATQLNVAEARKRAVPHRHHTHQGQRARHRHATHRHHSYNVPRPQARPPRAHAQHSAYFYRGHWVMTHHRSHLIWRWNHYTGRWVVVFRF